MKKNHDFRRQKTKPNSEMNVTFYLTKDYENVLG